MYKKVELKVVNISNSREQAPAFALLLKEVNGNRQLPIIIGPSEAQAITFRINNVKSIRPLTHDLFASVLSEFSIAIEEVLIYKVRDGLFYSYIFFKKGEDIIQLDSRTSDAISIALRFDAPIYIFDEILSSECVKLPDPAIDKENQEKTDYKVSFQSQFDQLKEELEQAIKAEDYEKASMIRDELERRKKQQ